MRVHVQYATYDGGGYERTLSLCGWFIEKRLGHYGDAISDIWVLAFMPPRVAHSDHLESLRVEFVESLDRLPEYRFSRKKRSMDIQAITDFVPPPFRSRHFDRTYQCTPELFAFGVREIIRIISPMVSKFTRRDAFDVASFMRDLVACADGSPMTEEEIESLRLEQSRKFDEARQSADPWERLGIDWDDYHRSARKLLNDPFYWEQDNDLAPNGNDTGADVLIEYMSWRVDNKRANPMTWLESLLAGWDVDLALAPTGTDCDVAALLGRNEFSLSTWDDAAIGIAFACLKVDGKLSRDVAALAIHSIGRQSLDVVVEQRGWRDANERKQSLARLATVLKPHARAGD